MVPAYARRATSVRTVASGDVRTPAVGEETARRACASVKRATRALTARQVGRGAPWGAWQGWSSKLTGGGKRDGRKVNFRQTNSHVSCSHLLSKSADFLSQSQLSRQS